MYFCRVREEIALKWGYAVKGIFWRMHARTEQLKAEGWQIVSPAPCAKNRRNRSKIT